MKAVVFYFIQLLVTSGLLYGYYYFVLQNKRFHYYNRFYLLSAVLISIFIPFINIPVYFTEAESHASIVLQTLTQISLSNTSDPDSSIVISNSLKETWFTLQNLSYFIYILIAAIAFLRI